MNQRTEPLPSPHSAALLRYDPSTGTLRERRYQIAVIAGPDTGRLEHIEGRLTVGSRPGVGLRLKDTSVSRHHFELLAKPEGVLIRDLESTNGTWLAGARIREVVVEDEAIVTIGKTSLRISIQEENLGAPKASSSFGNVLGASPSMQAMFGLLGRVSKAASTVLLIGEPGTGKSLLARSIHQNSERVKKPFVTFPCIPSPDIDSELFGRVASHTHSPLAGAFLNASGGTLYLQNIDALPENTQLRLLSVFESGNIQQLGADKPQRIDVRMVASTQKNLDEEVAQGRFSQELLYQLAVIQVHVPPLRERLEDIPLLAQEFVRLMGRGDFELPRGLMALYGTYDWPGNVQELRNLVERALAGDPLATPPRSGAQTPAPIKPTALSPVDDTLPFKEAKERLVDSFTREYLLALHERCGGNISRMAREAGIARNYVHRLVTKYGLKAVD